MQTDTIAPSSWGDAQNSMALPCAQVQCSWGENRNADAADIGGEEATQHGPDLGTAPGGKALKDRYAHTDQDIPPRPTWAGSHAAVCVSPGMVESLRKRLLPAWCAPLAHGLSLLLVAVAVAISGWIGASFPPSVSVMWLLSSSSSFLASFLGWEPLKVRRLVEGRGLPVSCLPADRTATLGPAGSSLLLPGSQAATP